MIGVNVYTIQKDGMTFRGHDGDDRFVTVSEFMAVVDRVTAFPHADVACVIRNAIAVALAAKLQAESPKFDRIVKAATLAVQDAVREAQHGGYPDPSLQDPMVAVPGSKVRH
jgi:hypothetical protein